MNFDFASLIRPIDPAAFFRDTWEKQPLVVSRNAPDHYSTLFSHRDVDAVICFTRPKFPPVPIGRRKATGPEGKTFVGGLWESFVRGLSPQNEKHLDRYEPGLFDLRQAYAQGQTVVIDALQQRWPPVAALCRNMEALLHHPVHVNMYLTPRGAQGYPAHFDTHDVFIVQVEGSKQWRLYGTARELPLSDEATALAPPPSPPEREVCLNAGDLLYLPRGHIHEAFTTQCASLHLTVGVPVFRWADLLGSALACVSRHDVRFRRALPPGFLNDEQGRASLRESLRELLQSLADSAQLDEAVEDIGSRLLHTIPALPDGHFVPAEEIERVDADTVVEKAVGTICQVIEHKDTVTIQFPGNLVSGPQQIGPALRFIASSGRFTARSLPDSLSAEAKLVLVRRLIREGLLKVLPRTGACRDGLAAPEACRDMDRSGVGV